MAYDEQTFQKTITDLKDSLVSEDSKINANLSSINLQLTSLNEHLIKLTHFTMDKEVDDLKEMALGVFLHSKAQNKRDKVQEKNDEDRLEHEKKRDADDNQRNADISNQITLLAGMTDILNLMSMDLSDIRNLMVTGQVDKNIMQQEGEARMRERDMIAQLVSKETMGIRGAMKVPGEMAPTTASDVEEDRDEEKGEAKTRKLLGGMLDSLKKMAASAGKVAKGGLIAMLSALGLLALMRLFQSETWKKFADNVAGLINWLINDAGIFTKVATVLGLLVLAFKPLLVWKGIKFLAAGIKAMILMSKSVVAGTAGAKIKGAVGGIAQKVGGVFGKKGAGSMPVPQMGGAKVPDGLSKSGGWTKSLASGTKNIGTAMKNIGKGAGNFFMMLFKGIGRGLKFLGHPKALLGVLAMAGIAASVWIFSKAMKGFSKVKWKAVAIGITTVIGFGALAALAGAISPLLLAGALAIGAIGTALIPFAAAAKIAEGPMQKFANIFKALAKVPFKNLALAGPALAAMAVGFMALSAGGLLSGIADAFSNFFSKDPVTKLQEIAKAAPGVDLMGRAFKTFLKGVTGFMKFLKGDRMDLLSDAFAKMGAALKTLPTKTITQLGTLFKWWSKIELGVIEKISELKISALDDKTTANWITLLDELGSFGSMFGNSLDDLAEMFDKLSKTNVGHLDWSGLKLQPVNKKDVDQYIRLIDKLIELAEESKEGSTFILGDQTGTIMGRGSSLSKTWKTSTNVYQDGERVARQGSSLTVKEKNLGGVQRDAKQVVKEATKTPVDSVKKDAASSASQKLKEKIQAEAKAQYQAAEAELKKIQDQIAALGPTVESGPHPDRHLARAGYKKKILASGTKADQQKFEELERRASDLKDYRTAAGRKYAEAEGVKKTKEFGETKDMMVYDARKRIFLEGVADFNKVQLLLKQGHSIKDLQDLNPQQMAEGKVITIKADGNEFKVPNRVRGFYEEWLKQRLEGKTKATSEKKPATKYPPGTIGNLVKGEPLKDVKPPERKLFTADSQAGKTMARIMGIKEKYEMVKSANLSAEDIELQKKIADFKKKWTTGRSFSGVTQWKATAASATHGGEAASEYKSMIDEAKELGIYRREKHAGSRGGSPFDFVQTQRQKDLGILKSDKEMYEGMARIQLLDFKQGGKGSLSDKASKRYAELFGRGVTKSKKAQRKGTLDRILQEQWLKSGMKKEDFGGTYTSAQDKVDEHVLGKREDGTYIMQRRIEQTKGDIVNLAQYAEPTPKVLSRPLTIDPAVKKLELIPQEPDGAGVQVANNSGNTNVTTSQYFMGESSKTGDSRVLSYQGHGY